MKHFKQFLLFGCLLLLLINTQQAFSNPGEYYIPHNWFEPNGRYVSAPGDMAQWASGIVIRNIVLRDLNVTRPPTAPPGSDSWTGATDLDVSLDNGITFQRVHASSNNTLYISHASDVGDKSFFDIQMTQYDFSIPSIPLLIRESPTLASSGQHTIDPYPDAGYMVESFFDVFFEVSINGGVTWWPAANSIRMSLYFPPEYQTSSPNYPPFLGRYAGKSTGFDADFGSGIIIRNFKHDQPTANLPPPPPGGFQIHNFGARARFDISYDNGLSWIPVTAPTSDQVRVQSAVDVGSTRTFNTEMLSLNLSAPTPFGFLMMRESPTRASTGRMNIMLDPTTGLYRFSSFFDIFFELSIDGGANWWPAINSPLNLEMDPQTELDTFQYSKAHVLIQPPAAPPEVVNLSGPTIVRVHIPPEGTAQDNDMDGLDEVQTEILSMTLTGVSSMGPLTFTLDNRHRSLGQIEEIVNSNMGVLDVPPFEPTGTASSFFDVFFEIDITGMPPMYGAIAAHMTATITHKPPAVEEAYNLIGPPIALVDLLGNPTGVTLITASHTPVPYASISGYKWDDLDNSNTWDPGEGTLSGWTINLSGPVTTSIVTDDDGWYQFTNLSPGVYTVSENVKTDWAETYPITSTHTISLAGGENVAGGKGKTEVPNFGNHFTLGCKAWTRWYDKKIEGMGFKIPTEAKLMTRNLAVDSSGNIYICGYSDGFGTKNDYVTIKYDMDGTEKWTERWNNTAVNKDDKAYALTIDHQGNVYVTGESDFGGSKADIITIKYDASGTQKWVKRWNGLYNDRDAGYAIALSLDEAKVYVTGESNNGRANGPDYVTVAYDAALGLEYWATTYNGPGSKIDKAYAIAIDPTNGNVVVTGESDGGASKADYATVWYNPTSGTQVWVSRYDKISKNDYAFAVKIDGSGNVYVTGASEGSTTKFDYATVKYTGAGAYVWDKRYNYTANKNDYAYDLALDNAGNIYVTGTSESRTSGFDYATLKYDPVGTMVWSAVNRYEGKKKDIARSIAVCDAGNNVVVTGSSDQGTGRKLDYLTQKIDASLGTTIWTGRYNGAALGDDIAYNVAVRPEDCCIILTGTSYGGATPKLDFATIQGPSGSSVPGPITSPAVYDGEENEDVPLTFALQQNYPNPFNPKTLIRFSLPVDAIVTLKVYDVLGQEITVLLNQELLDRGYREVEFNAQNYPSGVYFYRLLAEGLNDEGVKTGTFQAVNKMILLK